MSSFFTNGFAGIFNNRRKKKEDKTNRGGSSKIKQDEGGWNMLTDAYGRPYWQHRTGETRYVYGGGLVSPIGTVNPSPMVYPAGGAVFTPSPVYAVAPPKKEQKKEKGKGTWETKYDDDGDRYWKHTVSKKTTYRDPYF